MISGVRDWWEGLGTAGLGGKVPRWATHALHPMGHSEEDKAGDENDCLERGEIGDGFCL